MIGLNHIDSEISEMGYVIGLDCHVWCNCCFDADWWLQVMHLDFGLILPNHFVFHLTKIAYINRFGVLLTSGSKLLAYICCCDMFGFDTNNLQTVYID